MIRRLNRPLGGAALAAVAAVVVSASTPAYAAGSGDVKVVNTETVQVYTSPTGEVKSKMVYEQTSLTGHGTAEIANPVSTDNLRNLDGFGKPEVKNGQEITKTTVDGTTKLRSVSDFNRKLPLEVSVAYTLDGKPVKPADVVGASGRLDVKFTVKNVTAKKQVVTFKDGKGNTVTKTDEVPIPMVATVDTVAPSTFTNVKSVAANMGGDGHGGTAMKFLLTLFPPIGSDTAVFGYSADIKHGVVPRAEITAVPVNPLTSPTYATAASSYQGGVDSGTQVTDGAIQIDTNLLKLRDGAGTLLAGLIKLRDGAGDLQAGLAGQALPGSKKLASGASDLSTGLGQLNSGSKKLAAGTGEAYAGSQQLAGGTKTLKKGVGTINGKLPELQTGVGDLAAGQIGLAAGLKKLYDGVSALPESVQATLSNDPQYQLLLGTLNQLIVGIGDTDSKTTDTIMGGLFQIRGGLRTPYGYANNDCAVALGGGTPTKCGVADAAEFMKSLLPAKKAQLTCASAVLADIAGGATAPAACFGGTRPPGLATETNPVNAFVLNDLATKLASGASDLDGLMAGLAAIENGVDGQLIPGVNQVRKALYNAPCDPAQTDKHAADFCGVSQAIGLVSKAIPTLVSQLSESISNELLASIGRPTPGCDPTATLRCAADALANGGNDLTVGVDKLVAGFGQLNTGSAKLANGAATLSTGLGQLDSGANQLADGAAKADDGGQQVAKGSSDLSDGLGTATDGSIKLHNGLITAAGGAPKLENGAQQLSDKGTKKLIAGGNDTTAQYAELNAVLAAGAKRATTEDMAFGAPKGAMGLTAYNFIVNGQNSEDSHNLARGLGGLALLGAGGAVFAMRRRLV